MALFAVPVRVDGIPKTRAVVQVRDLWVDDWETADYLEALRVMEAAQPGLSKALFRYRYGAVRREDKTTFSGEDPAGLANRFVRVCLATPYDAEPVPVWYGVLADEKYDVHGAKWWGGDWQASGDQMVQAFGLEHLLDSVRVTSAMTAASGGGAATEVDWCPIFNQRWRDKGWIDDVGNRTVSLTDDGVYAFCARDGLTWVREDVVRYLLHYYAPIEDACAGITWSVSSSGAWGMDATDAELWRLEGLTIRECFNVLFDRRRARSWCLRTDGAEIRVHVFSLIGQAKYSTGRVPQNTERHGLWLDEGALAGESAGELAAMKPVVVTLGHSQRADEVVAEGALVKSTFSVSVESSSLEGGYTVGEETEYDTAGGGTPKEKDNYRSAVTAMQRVYCYYRVPDAWTWDTHGGGNAAPSVLVDGTLDMATQANRWMGGKRFMASLPFKDAIGGTGAEQFRPFQVFLARPDDPTKYLNLRRGYTREDDGFRIPRVPLALAADEMGILLKPGVPHFMGANSFTGETTTQPVLRGGTIIATVCVETDERFRIVRAIPGGPGVGPRRTRVISVPDAELWTVADGTIDEVNADGTLHVSTNAGFAVRNDLAMLTNVADLAVAWYGHERRAIEATLEYLAPFVPVGGVVVGQTRAQVFGEVNTVVTTRLWDCEHLRTTIKTEFVDLDVGGVADTPGFPTRGSMARAVARHRGEIASLRSAVDYPRADDSAAGDVTDYFMGYVASDPPGGYSIPGGEPLYALKEVECVDVAGDPFTQGIEWGLLTNGRHVMAKNLGETSTAHGLVEGSNPAGGDAVIVEVRRVMDDVVPGQPRFFFRRSVAATVGFTAMENGFVVASGGGLSLYPRVYWDDGIQDDEVRVYYAFAYDGDNVSEGRTFADGLMFLFGSVLPDLGWEFSPIARTNLDLDFEFVTEAWDTDTLVWGNQPATAGGDRLFRYNAGTFDDGGDYVYISEHTLVDHMSSVAGTVYGIVLKASLSNPPGVGYMRGGFYIAGGSPTPVVSFMEGSF